MWLKRQEIDIKVGVLKIHVYITLQTVIDPTLFRILSSFLAPSVAYQSFDLLGSHKWGNFKRAKKKSIVRRGEKERECQTGNPQRLALYLIRALWAVHKKRRQQQLVIKLTEQLNRSRVVHGITSYIYIWSASRCWWSEMAGNFGACCGMHTELFAVDEKIPTRHTRSSLWCSASV